VGSGPTVIVSITLFVELFITETTCVSWFAAYMLPLAESYVRYIGFGTFNMVSYPLIERLVFVISSVHLNENWLHNDPPLPVFLVKVSLLRLDASPHPDQHSEIKIASSKI
jgi:hypothetical protein